MVRAKDDLQGSASSAAVYASAATAYCPSLNASVPAVLCRKAVVSAAEEAVGNTRSGTDVGAGTGIAREEDEETLDAPRVGMGRR